MHGQDRRRTEGSPHAQDDAAEHHAGRHPDQSLRKSRFWRHFVEMIVAMVVGMAVLAVPFRVIFGRSDTRGTTPSLGSPRSHASA